MQPCCHRFTSAATCCRCAGVRPDGSQCERVIGSGSTYCYSHDPTRKEQRKRAAAKAGSTPWNSEVREAKKVLKDLAQGVLDGRFNRGDASVAAQVLGVLARFLEVERKLNEQHNVLERIAELEELANRQSTPSHYKAR